MAPTVSSLSPLPCSRRLIRVYQSQLSAHESQEIYEGRILGLKAVLPPPPTFALKVLGLPPPLSIPWGECTPWLSGRYLDCMPFPRFRTLPKFFSATLATNPSNKKTLQTSPPQGQQNFARDEHSRGSRAHVSEPLSYDSPPPRIDSYIHAFKLSSDLQLSCSPRYSSFHNPRCFDSLSSLSPSPFVPRPLFHSCYHLISGAIHTGYVGVGACTSFFSTPLCARP